MSFCLLTVNFLWCKIANSNPYKFIHTFSNKTKLINFGEWNVDQMWLKVRSSLTYSFVDPAKVSATCSSKNSLKKWSSLFRFTISWKRGTKLPQWNRFSWFRFSRLLCPRWVVEHHCCPRWLGSRQQRFCDQGLFLDLCLHQPLSQRTFLLNGLVPHVPNINDVHVSKLREHLSLHMHLHKRTPDHRHHHPRHQGLPIARFCFALALCAANFKPTVTWKQNGTAIVVRDQSSAVKRFIFVKKVQILQGCLCIPMASVTSRWERETAHLRAKISARTWTWTTQNDLITVKNSSMRSFIRILVAMQQMTTKFRCLKPHQPYTVDFPICARERVKNMTYRNWEGVEKDKKSR